MTLKKGWGMLLKNYPLKVGNAPEKSHVFLTLWKK
jgi:hypothetical protein